MTFHLKSITGRKALAGVTALALALSSTVAFAADKLQYFKIGRASCRERV